MTLRPWHADAWARLQARRERDALPHALLLAGPAGLGKRDFLAAFVKGLLCQRPVDGVACGTCRSCELVAAGTHPDLIGLSFGLRKDGVTRSEIVVDQIRDLSQRLSMASQFGGWQVVTIDPADAMNAAAANALLKTLEEPTPATLLVLLADEPARLPATIRSRCQRIDFLPPSRAVALDWLRAQGVTDAPAALDAAGGNPGMARTWATDGALKQRGEVRHDLKALAAGRGDAMEVVKRWQAADPARYLWFAAQTAADELRARASGQALPLDSQLDDEGLDGWYARANRARDALRGPLRTDLVLLELLAAWR
ncbi:DNA polymerase III subunit delta' [Luteibacter sp. UNCMF366Tsu5.1]|uniref:DNA polymerase III subunit delta' n=1 Tax=Luteibacter sp. UNCMF366Tsu5.1 TaxID=1502758 RepID=UPI0009087B1B|nr:DNA polymerase III subunit delta' [Luteibacter sp. UNCMF366Tsu5.1]SFW31472.1 DNA polymerase-3 subunit delta' [Luteibacter sp. UNCMF366Tsu5.1]